MKCPKCNHEQASSIECEACGIIFEKYYKHQKRLEEIDKKGSASGTGNSSGGMIWIVLGVVVSSIIAVIFYYSSNDNQTISPEQSVQIVKPNESIKDKPVLLGIKKQLYAARPPRNNIEIARNATVFIESDWGLGSGFFIDADCHIVTNRHVVEFSKKDREMLSDQLKQLKRIIEQEERAIAKIERQARIVFDDDYRRRQMNELEQRKEKLITLKRQYNDYKYKLSYDQLDRLEDAIGFEEEEIVRIEKELNTLYNGEYQQELKEELEKRKDRLNEAKERYEKYSRKMDSSKFGAVGVDLKITLVDDTEYSISSIELSDNHDLALLSPGLSGCPYIEASDQDQLEQGKKVYTIGSPVGLKYTVTSGIVSGYRKLLDEEFIQTDAPINPGNSGGPLIDDAGKVIGVNSAIIKNTEGIGFAIPIKAVFDDFGRYIN